MTETLDVVIAGGAVMGSAVAYFLRDLGFQGGIAVIERDPGYGDSATARSFGGVRQQFSTPGNVLMSLYGAEFVKRAARVLAVDGEGPDLGFRENGYLMLASPSGLHGLAANVSMQNRLGAEIALLRPAELERRFPWLDTEGLGGGALGLANEGWFDPEALLHGFRRKAISLGVRYVRDEVAAIAVGPGGIEGVRLSGAGDLACGILVNAAGPFAGNLARLAGCELPVRPRKRTSFVFDCRAHIGRVPLTVDISGVGFRPEGKHFIAIVSPPADDDPDATDLEPDHHLFDDVIWPALARRVPAFEAIRMTGAWAGHYDFNTLDQNAVIGAHPEIGGLYFCNGFSGHGLQQAPAAGRAVAEQIIHGEYRTLDLTAFGYERIAANRPLREANVV